MDLQSRGCLGRIGHIVPNNGEQLLPHYSGPHSQRGNDETRYVIGYITRSLRANKVCLCVAIYFSYMLCSNCDSDQWQFKGIFMRNLAYLYEQTNNQQYLNFINLNAKSIWNSDRFVSFSEFILLRSNILIREDSSLGLKWGGPYDTTEAARQSSALDALNAALLG